MVWDEGSQTYIMSSKEKVKSAIFAFGVGGLLAIILAVIFVLVYVSVDCLLPPY